MCLGNYGAQVQENLNKSASMWLGDDDDKPQATPPTVNIYNTLPNGDIKPAKDFDSGFNPGIKDYGKSNRSTLKTGKK